MAWMGDAWGVLRKIERLFELEAVQTAELIALKQHVAELERHCREIDKRVQRLENREDVVIDQAKSAARDASSQSTQNVVGDLARRIGVLEASRPKKHIE